LLFKRLGNRRGQHSLWTVQDDDGSVHEEEVTHLEVLGCHESPALVTDISDHDGDAVKAVTVPVLPLTLEAAVRDSMTPGTLGQLLVTGLATSVTTLPVCQRLWHLGSMSAKYVKGCLL